jgi:3-phosphoshikimate 1-carboxyvinyltransferase
VALPDLIEIVPLDKPVRAEITVPGSKSITNRALILAALAEGETTLEGALWSEDTQVMIECLQELGFMVNVAPDLKEPCNRTITLYGRGGVVPPGGTQEQPLELFIGNAGTAARFLAAFVCLGKGCYRLHGVPRMHERPQAGLFDALRQLGYAIESANDRLPATIYAAGPHAGTCLVSIEESSQFASGLLLSARVGGWRVEVRGENAEEAPYVAMTKKLIQAFPVNGGRFQIEPDASSGSYFLAADRFVPPIHSEAPESSKQFGVDLPTTRCVSVANWPHSGWQVDERFSQALTWLDFDFLHDLDRDPWVPETQKAETRALYPAGGISRKSDLGDSIMTAIVIAPFAKHAVPVRFTDLGRLRLQECERVTALRTELTKCGAKVIELGDTLEVFPSMLHGAEIETYNDHRMAMCFAILGLKVPGIKVKDPSCVKKTFPNFFQKLAAPPPQGLGATLREGRTGRQLDWHEVFAENP